MPEFQAAAAQELIIENEWLEQQEEVDAVMLDFKALRLSDEENWREEDMTPEIFEVNSCVQVAASPYYHPCPVDHRLLTLLIILVLVDLSSMSNACFFLTHDAVSAHRCNGYAHLRRTDKTAAY